MKRVIFHYILPWTMTACALYFACKDIEWKLFAHRLSSAQPLWVLLAALVMSTSYLFRSLRWQFLLPHPRLKYREALSVLTLGFFMNNILPARAGEVVRAATGAKVTGESRTRVLASIASERLVDGLTLSTFFAVFAPHLGDAHQSRELMFVAWGFALISSGVLVTLLLHRSLQRLFAERLGASGSSIYNHRWVSFVVTKLNLFLLGLSPLLKWPSSFAIGLWSLVIWGIELSTFFIIAWAFQTSLSLPLAILFLVTVNFSSLIPAAPGGLGVIEAAATAVLSSAGVEKELALSMVIVQHTIQYSLTFLGGIIALWYLKKIAPINQANALAVR